MSDSKPKAKRGRPQKKLVGETKKQLEKEFLHKLASDSKYDDERRTLVTCASSTFQYRSHRIVDGKEIPEGYFKFSNGRMLPTDEELEIAKQIIRGEYTDGHVPASHFQRIAKIARLQIVDTGFAAPPMVTWDSVDPAKVVDIAQSAGLLSDINSIKQALRYEKESEERTPSREVREVVVKNLQRLLDDVLPDHEQQKVDPAAPIQLPTEVSVG